MKTTIHDYTNRHWGHDYTITAVRNGGMEISMLGWGCGISAGDYMLIEGQSKAPGANPDTRYQVKRIRYLGNPPDMWSMEATFAPRMVKRHGWVNRLLRKFIRVQQDWHGEWRIYLFNRYTSLCWMDPREWRQGWWINYRKAYYDHGQTLYCIRLLGFDYHWSTYDQLNRTRRRNPQ